MAIELRYIGETTVPVEVEGILPGAMRGKPLEEIRRLPIYHGKEACELADFFEVSGDADDDRVDWEGDLHGVHWIGAGMDGGEMIVHGDAGRHVGSEMKRGAIRVEGSASDWVGGELHGGTIVVTGDAGHLVGAAYRGSARGMTGGEIHIHGRAGNEIGHTMRRGLIAVGQAGDLAGFNMLAGTLLICGECGIRHGAAMTRGTLLFVNSRPQLLPSFRYACAFEPPFLRLLFRNLQSRHYPIDESWLDCTWELFHGDMIEGGRGEVLMRR